MNNSEFLDFVMSQISAIALNPVADLDEDTEWMHIGLDSVDLMGVLGAIEEKLTVEMPEEAFLDHATIGGLADYALSLACQQDLRAHG